MSDTEGEKRIRELIETLKYEVEMLEGEYTHRDLLCKIESWTRAIKESATAIYHMRLEQEDSDEED